MRYYIIIIMTYDKNSDIWSQNNNEKVKIMILLKLRYYIKKSRQNYTKFQHKNSYSVSQNDNKIGSILWNKKSKLWCTNL